MLCACVSTLVFLNAATLQGFVAFEQVSDATLHSRFSLSPIWPSSCNLLDLLHGHSAMSLEQARLSMFVTELEQSSSSLKKKQRAKDRK